MNDDDPYADQLRNELADQSRALDPTGPLDDGLARIRSRVAEPVSAGRRWGVPLAAAATVVAVLAGGTYLWVRGGTEGPAPVGSTSRSPLPTISYGPQPTQTPSPSSVPQGPAVTVPVYYGGTFGGRTMLYREYHRTTEGPVLGALAEMLGAPQDPNYQSLWSRAPGPSLIHFTRIGAAATVTLAARPLQVSPAGLPIQEVVYTVTATDPTIRTVTVVYPGGRATNVSRGVSYTTLAMVWLLTPSDGATVSSPVSFGGLAEVYEATVSWEVDRPDGSVVGQGSAMASQAAPGRWPWSASVTLPPGSYVLKAFAISTKDGTVQWPDTKVFTVR
jgi:hypothetical protein